MPSKVNREDAKKAIETLIRYLGDDPEREGLLETPERVIRSYEQLYSGYKMNPADALSKAFSVRSNEMVVLANIEMYSTCEHHMLPFIGKCHIGYLPDKKVVGISKLARLMEVFARRLQIQEELTYQIAEAFFEEVEPKGVGVVVEAQHLCMTCRGIGKQNSVMTTSVMLGNFKEEQVKNEFYRLIRAHQ